jgi:hypothetical protein
MRIAKDERPIPLALVRYCKLHDAVLILGTHAAVRVIGAQLKRGDVPNAIRDLDRQAMHEDGHHAFAVMRSYRSYLGRPNYDSPDFLAHVLSL